MRAFSITAPFETAFRDVPEPELAPGCVLLAVKYVGLCGSDLNTFRGKNPLITLPRIPGHEISAVIADKAKDVPDCWRVGQKVTVSPYTNCGTITHTPVHTTTITGSIGLPSTIKLVEHRLVIHVHGNQHTIGNTFRNGRTRSFRGKYPASAFVIPSLFPQGIVVLDDLGIRKRNRIAVGALHVLRERERARHNRSRSQRDRTCRNLQ